MGFSNSSKYDFCLVADLDFSDCVGCAQSRIDFDHEVVIHLVQRCDFVSDMQRVDQLNGDGLDELLTLLYAKGFPLFLAKFFLSFAVRSTTVSQWSVKGNISTGWIFFTSNPFPVINSKSLARVTGLHEI